MKTLVSVLLVIFMIYSATQAQPRDAQHHAQMPLNCQECHSCARPTFEKPCLKLMPGFTREGITVFNSAAEAPEIIKIDTLEDLYEPTNFTHKLHAEMAFMSGGCISCHHFNPPGRVLSCIECHEPGTKREDITKPGLKGAYHRQCLNCHREWSHSTNCTVCHASKGTASTPAMTESKADSREKIHPELKIPTKLVYQVEFEDGPVVTFFHNEHSDLFGLKCQDCHQDESCGRCHDTMRTASMAQKDTHSDCVGCHEKAIEDNCQKCHNNKEKNPFNHATVGWPLNPYHQQLYCQECHGSQGKFNKLNRSCNSCHKSWNPNNFDHRLTGLMLDETHRENDCESCHLNRNFSAQPGCMECHDDLSYPANIPGHKISVKK